MVHTLKKPDYLSPKNISLESEEIFSDFSLRTHRNSSSTLPEKQQAKHMFIAFRHGFTPANATEKIKLNLEPLSREKELSMLQKDPQNYDSRSVAYQAHLLKNVLGPEGIKKIHIHTPPTFRVIQTVRIFAEIVGMKDFPYQEIDDIYEDIKRYPDANSLPKEVEIELEDRISNLQFPPQITIDKDLITRYKNKKILEEKADNQRLQSVGSYDDVEGSADTIARNANVLTRVQQNIKRHPQQDSSIHMFFGHRTLMEGFDALKNEKDILNLKPTFPTGEIMTGYINDNGYFINQQHINPRSFEFSPADYEEQLKSFKGIPGLHLNPADDIIINTNYMNAYLQGTLRSQLFVVKSERGKEKRNLIIENVRKFLSSEHKLIRDYTLYHILDNLDHILSPQSEVQIKTLLMEHIEKVFGVESKESMERKISIFKELYRQKKHLELWKYALYLLKKENNNISSEKTLSTLIDDQRKKLPLGPEGRIIEETDIEKELDLIDHRRKYEDMKVETLLGDMKLKDMYVGQHLTNTEGNNYDSHGLATYILQSRKKIFAIQAAGGSGKTALSRYLLSTLSDTHFLHIHNASSTSVKNVDLNDYSLDTLHTIFQGSEDVLIVDALDEKNPTLVKEFSQLSQSKDFTSNNKKIILLSRTIPNLFIKSQDKEDAPMRNDSESISLQEVVKADAYIDSYAKTLSPAFQKKFKDEFNLLLTRIRNNLHTPIILEMLARLIKGNIEGTISEEQWTRFFLDKEGNVKKDISRKDLYDEFFKFLYMREGGKMQSKKENKERTTEENPFMHPKYNQLRKEFLEFVVIYNLGLGMTHSMDAPFRSEQGNLKINEETLEHIFREFLLQKHDQGKIKNITEFLISKEDMYRGGFEKQKTNIDLFTNTLLNYGILKKGDNGQLTFHHKTFEDYFGYLYYLDATKNHSWHTFLYDHIKRFKKRLKDKLQYETGVDFFEIGMTPETFIKTYIKNKSGIPEPEINAFLKDYVFDYSKEVFSSMPLRPRRIEPSDSTQTKQLKTYLHEAEAYCYKSGNDLWCAEEYKDETIWYDYTQEAGFILSLIEFEGTDTEQIVNNELETYKKNGYLQDGFFRESLPPSFSKFLYKYHTDITSNEEDNDTLPTPVDCFNNFETYRDSGYFTNKHFLFKYLDILVEEIAFYYFGDTHPIIIDYFYYETNNDDHQEDTYDNDDVENGEYIGSNCDNLYNNVRRDELGRQEDLEDSGNNDDMTHIYYKPFTLGEPYVLKELTDDSFDALDTHIKEHLKRELFLYNELEKIINDDKQFLMALHRATIGLIDNVITIEDTAPRFGGRDPYELEYFFSQFPSTPSFLQK